MVFAAAISHHPDTALAVGEVVGQVLDTLGLHPDLVVLFATAEHAAVLRRAAQAVDTLLAPTALIGGVTTTVVTGGSAPQGGPALALWAGNVGPLRTFSVDRGPAGQLPAWLRVPAGGPPAATFEPGSVLVLADQRRLFEEMAPGLDVFGGVLAPSAGSTSTGPHLGARASTSTGPALVLGSSLRAGGAVGVALGGGQVVTTQVVPGVVAVGPPMAVTATDGTDIVELDRQPALGQLVDAALDSVAVEDLGLLATSLGVALGSPARSGGLRPVVGTDRLQGRITVAGPVPPGATARFFLPASDPDVAAQLSHLLTQAGPESGALVFAAPARVRALLPAPGESPDQWLGGALAGLPSAACVCAPIGGDVLQGHPLGVVVTLFSASPRGSSFADSPSR